MKRYAIRFRDPANHTWRTLVVRVEDGWTEDQAKAVALAALGLNHKLGELHAIELEGEDLRAVGSIVTVGLDEHLRESPGETFERLFPGAHPDSFYAGDFVRPRGRNVRWQVASGPVTAHDAAEGRTLLVLTPTPDGMITQAYDPAGFVLVERAR